jgi:hypothetical protein
LGITEYSVQISHFLWNVSGWTEEKKKREKGKKMEEKKTPGLHSLHRDEREKPYKCRAKSKGY